MKMFRSSVVGFCGDVDEVDVLSGLMWPTLMVWGKQL
jgi:hypothetical protein